MHMCDHRNSEKLILCERHSGAIVTTTTPFNNSINLFFSIQSGDQIIERVTKDWSNSNKHTTESSFAQSNKEIVGKTFVKVDLDLNKCIE